MNRDDFETLFKENLEVAVEKAETILREKIPRKYKIALCGFGYDPKKDRLDISSTVDKIYLGNDRFFRIIDIAVLDIFAGNTVILVCPSGHEPTSFLDTWNTPKGNGPFKQLGPEMKFVRRMKSN